MVVFNGITRQIEVTDPGIVSLDVELDIYSAWKDWSQLSDNSKYAPALRTFGGDQTIPGQFAPKYFFLQNYWQVLINNGNVVSVELNLYTDDFDTPYIVLPGSGVSDRNSDAVNLDAQEILFASYGDAINIDIINGTSGNNPDLGDGNKQNPVNNIVDALTLDITWKFKRFAIANSMPFGVDAVIDNYRVVGASHIDTILTFDTLSSTIGAIVENVTVQGFLDGKNDLVNCIVGTLDSFDGHIHDCSLNGDITLTGNDHTYIQGCGMLDIHTTPTIDMGITGQDLVMTNYSGIINIVNFNSDVNAIGIGLDAGRVVLNSSNVLKGTVQVGGSGILEDENGVNIPTGTWNNNVTIINTLNSESCGDLQPVAGSIQYDTKLILQEI